MEGKPLSSYLSGFFIYAIRHRGDAYKQSANIGKNNEPIQNRLLFLIGCKSVTLHHFTILSFPMVRPAWDNWWLLVVTAFLPFYPLVTNSLSITSDFCLSPLFIRRDKNGTKPENKISKNTFGQSSPCSTLLCDCKGTILSRKKRRKLYNSLVLWHFF